MIDVVMPVYNGARYLEEAVSSVLAQTVAATHIIIVDDGSTDATGAIARRLAATYAGTVRYVPGTHRGVSASRNRGVRLSSAPYVAFLDADDIWLPTKLERQIPILESAPRVGLVHCSYEHIDERGRHLPDARVVPPLRRGDLFEPLLFDDYVLSGSASAAVVRRTHLEAAGEFDESLWHGEDWDLWLRLAAICDIDFVPDVLVQVRVHPRSAQRVPWDGRDARFALQRMKIYAKWSEEIARSRSGRSRVRRSIATSVLVACRRPGEVNDFYRRARQQGDVVFGGPLVLWWTLLLQAVRLGAGRWLLRKAMSRVRGLQCVR